MTVDSEKRTRQFTLAEANASLPLVRAITGDIVDLTKSMMDRRERLQYLKQGRNPKRSDIYQDELDDIEQILEADSTRLQDLVEELTDLGVELKSLPEGLIDFPSTRNGRPVYLCWKYNEPEVAYWHELNAGFSGRQAIQSGEELASRLSSESVPAEGILSSKNAGEGMATGSDGSGADDRAVDGLSSDSDVERN